MGLDDLACFALVVVLLEATRFGVLPSLELLFMGQDAPAEAARALCILESLLRRQGPPFHSLCSALASSTGLQIALTGLNNPYMRAYRYGRPS